MAIYSDRKPSSGSPEVETPKITPKDLGVAAWTCSLGSALEYYDFALYSLASALIFGPLFFPKQAEGISQIASFATYFIGFAVRPVGGIVFGALGDRLGRKFVLVTTVILMGLASTLIGVLPPFSSAGYWAPFMLIILRVLQGLGAGAEQAGAAVLMTEFAPRERRGYFAALPFLGIQLGTVLASLVYFLVQLGVKDPAHSWQWRVPFLFSFLIVAVAIYMRINLKESPTFSKLEARRQTAEHPLATLMKKSKKTVTLGIGLRLAENGGSSIYGALAVSYVVAVVGVQGSVGTLALVFAPLLGAAIVPLAGILADRHGRVIVYRGFAIFQLLIAFPVWWVLSRGEAISTIIVITIALAVGTWGMFGAQGALLPELFGANHRYIGVSMAREVSAVISGGIAPLIGSAIIAWVISANGRGKGAGIGAWVPLAGYVALLTLGTIITTFFTPEPRGRDLDDLRDAIDAK